MPDSAAMNLQPSPGRPLGGNHGHPVRQCFRDRHREVFIQARQHKQVCSPDEFGLRVAVDRCLDRGTCAAGALEDARELGRITMFVRPDDPEPPIRETGFERSPGMR